MLEEGECLDSAMDNEHKVNFTKNKIESNDYLKLKRSAKDATWSGKYEAKVERKCQNEHDLPDELNKFSNNNIIQIIEH